MTRSGRATATVSRAQVIAARQAILSCVLDGTLRFDFLHIRQLEEPWLLPAQHRLELSKLDVVGWDVCVVARRRR